MTPTAPIGFGILGAGLVAPFHAKGIRHSQGGRLVAITDTNRARAEKLAAEYGARAYGSLDDMLRDPEVQVVNVCLPNHLHYDAVLACAQAGRHVLTEKPPAMTLRETDAMIAACARAGVKFGCTVQCRVRQSIQAVRRAVTEGRFGRLLQADAIMKWFRPTDYYLSDAWRMTRKSGAGVTVQHAFHYLDLLHYLGGEVAEVEARMLNLAHPEVHLEDTVYGWLTFRNGARGLLEASTAMWPGLDIRIEIHGTHGTAVVVGERMAVWTFREERPEDNDIRQYGNATQATGATGAADFGYRDHAVVIQDMIDAIRENRDVIIPVSSVRNTVEIVLALYQSAAHSRPVTLPVTDDDSVWEWRA
jgi:UDP-N-acetyl-2-amino-2-deoxyglucuronate dehydrogenase